MKFPIAERFKAPQGEGVFAGTPMAFIRLVGCSVGQTVCTACDTDFDTMRADLGGGLYTPDELRTWVGDYQHVCLTGGEPLDRDLRPLLRIMADDDIMVHIETSGTKHPEWLDQEWMAPLWLTVSPKPGYREDMLTLADEVKMILGGLGDGPGWPTLADALRWTDDLDALVYVQPRNDRLQIHHDHMAEAVQVVTDHPQLRLSTQLHKYIRTR